MEKLTKGKGMPQMLLLDFEDDQTLSEKSFLLTCHDESAVIRTIIARAFNDAMQTLCPDRVNLTTHFC
jgi:hypothetical protein